MVHVQDLKNECEEVGLANALHKKPIHNKTWQCIFYAHDFNGF